MNKLTKFFIFLIPLLYLIALPLPVHSQDNTENAQAPVESQEQKDPVVPTDEQEDSVSVASRDDKYNLYSRNRDQGNWDVRTNWQYQKEEYFQGETKLNERGPAYMDDSQNNGNYRSRGW